ncbi:MAG: DNA-binding response regulator [Bacteroidetes bacterium]|nr:MAG: DNA-binding response regulator [Bacteroidota bacterium]
MIHCIAIDDEPLALEVIRKYASEIPFLHLAETFTDAIRALSYLKRHPVDLLFLDIRMPDINGIRFFESLAKKSLVIFTTAFSEFAVKGFEVEAVDYLVKPIKFDRFATAVARAQKRLEGIFQETSPGDAFIFVKSEYRSVKITLNDIWFIEGFDDYIKIHLLKDPSPVLTLISLKAILKRLPAGDFIRVHRSFIVPVKHILSIHNRQVDLDNVKIPLGDTYMKRVLDWMKHQ